MQSSEDIKHNHNLIIKHNKINLNINNNNKKINSSLAAPFYLSISFNNIRDIIKINTNKTKNNNNYHDNINEDDADDDENADDDDDEDDYSIILKIPNYCPYDDDDTIIIATRKTTGGDQFIIINKNYLNDNNIKCSLNETIVFVFSSVSEKTTLHHYRCMLEIAGADNHLTSSNRFNNGVISVIISSSIETHLEGFSPSVQVSFFCSFYF